MTVGHSTTLPLAPEQWLHRRRPVAPVHASAPVRMRRAGESPVPRSAGSVTATHTEAPVAAPGFAAQAIAWDLLLDLRPSPQPARKLVAHYARADGLLADPDRRSSGILV